MTQGFEWGKTAVKRDDPRMADGDGPPMPHAPLEVFFVAVYGVEYER